MSMFTIRVELHAAEWADYVKLAKLLAAYGITDVIKDDQGRSFKMPPAEYNYVGNRTLQEVFASVEAAAQAVGRKYGILVNEATGRRWIGLDFA